MICVDVPSECFALSEVERDGATTTRNTVDESVAESPRGLNVCVVKGCLSRTESRNLRSPEGEASIPIPLIFRGKQENMLIWGIEEALLVERW